MKKLLLIPVLILSFVNICQSAESDILGIWLTQLKDAKIEIYKKENQYYGKVIWLKSPTDADGKAIVDDNNPDNSLKNRPIFGMDIITKLSYSNNVWSGGYIYDPKNGETYDCKIWLENGQIKLRGYLGWFFDTKTWTKA